MQDQELQAMMKADVIALANEQFEYLRDDYLEFIEPSLAYLLLKVK